MNFTILQLERNNNDGVVVAHWQVTKTSGDNVASAFGAVNFLPDATSEGFIPYVDLTEDIVIGWVQDTLDPTKLEAVLDSDLAEQVAPTIIKGTPW